MIDWWDRWAKTNKQKLEGKISVSKCEPIFKTSFSMLSDLSNDLFLNCFSAWQMPHSPPTCPCPSAQHGDCSEQAQHSR